MEIISPSQVNDVNLVKKKRDIFRDDRLQRKFDLNGYVVVDFLTADEVAAIRQAYFQLKGDLGEPAFASTVMSRDIVYRLAVSALIEETFARAVDALLLDAHFFWGNFNIKFPGRNMGTVPLHQDPSFLDERYFHALGIWVPLTDTDEQNGALQVIPGSHTILKQPRCGGRPFPYSQLQDTLLKQFGRRLHMRGGQAYIGNPALFHASPPNSGNQPRIVAAGLGGAAESRLRYFNYKEVNGAGVAEMFEVDYDYYVTAPLFSRPDSGRYSILEEMPLYETPPSPEALFEHLNKFIPS